MVITTTINIVRYIKRLTFGLPGLIVDFSYDLFTYICYSNVLFTMKDKEAIVASIVAGIHNIEKGLSLPNPRPGFGADNLKATARYLRCYVGRFGTDELIGRAQAVLRAYVEFNQKCHCSEYPEKSGITWALSLDAPSCQGGVKEVTRASILETVHAVSPDFFLSRSSVRIFGSEPVDLEKVIEAIKVAQKAPSVCNRQSGFVYIITDKTEIAKALSIQGGADGFSDNIPLLLVITTRTRNFWGAERNQRWIDGGLFAMSLMLGLHREGLGTCALNWSKTAQLDRQFKKEIRIPLDHSIIFLLAVGNIPEKVRVARSEKRPVQEMYEIR